MRSDENQCQQPKPITEAPAPAPARRPFSEPVLTRHEPVTRITLLSDDFTGSGSGGGGGTFF